MSYSKLFYPRTPQIPTILSLVIILAVVLFLAKLFSTQPPASSAKGEVLRQMMVANVAVNQVSIYWQSPQKSIDWVVYGEKSDDLRIIALDDRDIPDSKAPRVNHLVTLKDLKDNSTYFFKIVSNKILVGDLQNKPFIFKTSSAVNGSSNLKPAYGAVVAQNGTALENAAVIITDPGAYPLVALTKSSGDWLVPLNNIVDTVSTKPKLVTPSEKMKIEIYDEEGTKSTIDAVVSVMSPIPQTIIMGKDYSFTGQTNVLSATAENSSVREAKRKTTEILFPKEGAVIPGLRPLIKGTAAPDTEVVVIINSTKSYSYRTKTDKDGVWRVEITDNLPAGDHTITMMTKDSSGQPMTIVRSFSIAKSGEQVLGSATPEGAPVATVSPTLGIYPTSSSTTSALVSPPVTGPNPLPYILGSGSLIILGLGLLLAF